MMTDLNEMSLLDLFLMETGSQCVNLNHELSRWGFVHSSLEGDSVQSPQGGAAPPPPRPSPPQGWTEQSPANGGGGALDGYVTGEPDFNAMQRAVHSIIGAARIVDLQAVIDLTQAMEHGLAMAAAQPTAEIRELIESAVNHLNQLAQTKTGQVNEVLEEKKNIFANLVTLLRALQPAEPLPPTPGKHPARTSAPSLARQGLFQIFREDAENHLAVLSDNLLQIEKTP